MPPLVFDFQRELMRFGNRVGAYLALLTDQCPSTVEEPAVNLNIDYPDAGRDLNRGLPLVTWFLAIPHDIVPAVLVAGAVVASGPDIQTRHYFHGTVNGTPQAMSVRFARYAPALAQIMATAPDGRTAVSLAVGVWYNPDMRRTLLAREQILIPDTPGIFESMASRLSTYALLWLGFLGYWTALGLFVRGASRRQVQQR